jgi:oligosaccharide reducing-end xylanase
MADRPIRAWWLGLAGLLLCTSCKTTLDSLGCQKHPPSVKAGTEIDGGTNLASLHGPSSYPNAFRDLLGKTDIEIDARIAAVFDQLFHGDTATEAVFVPVGNDQAYIFDALHGQVRSEGLGLGMLITVSLDKRDEFDRLWRYTKSIQIADGAAQGYVPSWCGSNANGSSCYDPYGLEQIATALLLARGRWHSSPADIDYGAEAATLLDVIRNKEANNCGIADGITGIFDPQSKLPYPTPTTDSAGVSGPAMVMPAYYELWHQATGDAFWSQAAAAGRVYWQASANITTGLLPDRATLDGKPVPDHDTFMGECYRTLFNLALDRIWFGQSSLTDQNNRLLQFFYEKGLPTYGSVFELDGTTIKSTHDRALVSANGALALAATADIRRDFVSDVWNLGSPLTGTGRYYQGMMYMLALLTLGGQLRVY